MLFRYVDCPCFLSSFTGPSLLSEIAQFLEATLIFTRLIIETRRYKMKLRDDHQSKIRQSSWQCRIVLGTHYVSVFTAFCFFASHCTLSCRESRGETVGTYTQYKSICTSCLYHLCLVLVCCGWLKKLHQNRWKSAVSGITVKVHHECVTRNKNWLHCTYSSSDHCLFVHNDLNEGVHQSTSLFVHRLQGDKPHGRIPQRGVFIVRDV